MQKDWVVYSKHCLNRTDSIIGYLARYTHRIAISNQRLIDINQDQVRFSYKDYKTDQRNVMALHPGEFIRRFLMHVLPKGLMRIRHYGLLANRCRQSSLEIIRKILASPAPVKQENTDSELTAYPCPKCRKGQLIAQRALKPVWHLTHPLPS